MFNVTITYKSGKIEHAQIPVGEYTKALVRLAAEGRLVSMKITGTI